MNVKDADVCRWHTPAADAEKDRDGQPRTSPGKDLKRILAPLESEDAWPKIDEVQPKADWAEFLRTHPAFRLISPGG